MLHDDFVNPIKETPLEKCKLGNTVIDIPQELCEQKSLFKEVINLETWENVLSNEQRAHLMKFLPTFPENDTLNKQQAIRDLLMGTNVRFGNPLDHFHKQLKDGLFSPDMAKMATVLRRAKYHEYIYQQQRYFYKLLQEILVSRKRLLDTAAQLPPDQPVRMERIQPKPVLNSIEQRTKRKYLKELQEIREEVGELATSSEDENYPEAVPQKLSKRQKRQRMQLEASLTSEAGCVMSTLAPKSHLPGSSNGMYARSVSPFEVTEENYREMLTSHKCRRQENEVHPELDVGELSLQDIVLRANVPKRSTAKPASMGDSLPRRKGNKDRKKANTVQPVTNLLHTNVQASISEGESTPLQEFQLLQPKIEPMSPESEFSEAASALTTFNNQKLESCNNVEPEMDSSTLKLSAPQPLSQGTYSNFFSLLRDLICESHSSKITTLKLEEKVQFWQESPFSGLNDWYCLTANWSELTLSALKFLAGQSTVPPPDNFIPYIDHKEKHQFWRWAGEGRDSDEQLAPLASYWFDARQDEEMTADILDSVAGSPPPPRVRTDWSVRPALDEEKMVYRDQERCRYENPHKAFTFSMHCYEAVVGPVKGVYGKDAGMNKAREHSLLISDRPPFVTILSLVRDAAARLPNGEGTRADICELLKDSQFLAPATDSQIHTVVSGALDRLHYEKDPCVKYDVNRKMWIYLHRHRSEEEYERIHHAQANVAKTKKVVSKPKVKQIKNKSTSSRPASSLSTASTDSLLSSDLPNLVCSSSTAPPPLPLPPPPPVVSTPSPVRTGASSPRIGGNQMSPKTPTANSHVTSSLPTSLSSAPKQSIPSPAFYHPMTNTMDVSKSIASIAPVATTAQSSINLPVLGRSMSSPAPVALPVKVEPQEIVHKVSTNDILGPPPFILPSTQNNACPQIAVSNSKVVSSSLMNPNQMVNITQVQLVGAAGIQQTSIPITVSAASTKFGCSSSVAHLTAPNPPRTIGAIMAQQAAAAAARAVTVNTQAIGTVKLFPSGLTQTQTSTTLTGKPIAATMVTHPVSQATLQGVPTIVIKQEGHNQMASSLAAKAAMSSSKPVVARIISPPQVVSVGNLIASTLAATQKQGNPIHGGTTHTIKIQGSNLMRPVGGKPSHINMLQASTSSAVAGGQGLPRLTIVSQGNTTNLIPVCGATVTCTTQPKLVATPSGQIGIVTSQLSQQGHLSNVTKPTILTTPSGIKIVSAAASPNVSLAQLTGKPCQNVVVTSRPQTPTSVTVTMGTTAVGQQNLILTGGMQASSPTVMISSQRTLKPAHHPVVMAGGTTPTVMMATQPNLRPITASVNVKTLQGVKVIPVTQTNVGTKGKTQPVFARIITPPTNLTLRPSATQQGIGLIHAVTHVPTAGMNPVTTATLNTVRNPNPPNLAQATIIRVQTPQAPVAPTILYPDHISKEPQ